MTRNLGGLLALGWRRHSAGTKRPAASATGRSRAGSRGLAGGLELRSAAARADQGLGRRPLDVDPEGLEVWLHAAVGSNAVHSRRLRVEAAHRDLAAECAGAGHAWSSVLVGRKSSPGRGRTE